jgi:hypothetical protein
MRRLDHREALERDDAASVVGIELLRAAREAVAISAVARPGVMASAVPS